MPPTCGLQPQHAQDSSATRPLQRPPKLNAALERVGVGWYLGSGLGRVPGDARGVRCALSVLLLLLRSVLDRPEPLGLSHITTNASQSYNPERDTETSARVWMGAHLGVWAAEAAEDRRRRLRCGEAASAADGII